MLKTIAPLLSPQLLKTLAEMGHGDEIIFSDAHFPAHAIGKNGGPVVIHADCLSVSSFLSFTIFLFFFFFYSPPLVMMAAVAGDTLDASVEKRYLHALFGSQEALPVERIDRFAFYQRAQQAYAIVITGETAKYGNILLKKGVTPVF